MDITQLKGSIVALVTPMLDDGTVDFQSYKNLINWHIASGTKGLVLCGTTGEAATLSDSEWEEVIKCGVMTANKRIPVIAGTGLNSTSKTIEKTKKAAELGVQAALIVTPYYNKPTQNGLFLHYTAIHQAVPNLPIILYNVPGRTACDMAVETVHKIAQTSPMFIGIKEASGKFEKYAQLRKTCKPKFLIYSGEDDQSCEAILTADIDGVISVTTNVSPAMMAMMCDFALQKNNEKARELNRSLSSFHSHMFIETNPIPAKWTLFHMKKITTPNLRLPLSPLSDTHHKTLANDVLNNLSDAQKMGISQDPKDPAASRA